MAFQRRLGELTTICLVWCLFGVYFYRAPERIGRTEENIEKTHNDQYSQQYLHMSCRCYELAKEVEGIPTIPTISISSINTLQPHPAGYISTINRKELTCPPSLAA